LEAIFDPQVGSVRELRGAGGVEVERKVGQAPVLTSTSREMRAWFEAGGEWARVEQAGNVRIREDGRTAEASRAQFDRAGRISLEGSVMLADGSSRTRADAASFVDSSQEFTATGNVVTSEILSGGNTGTPAHISADRLSASTVGQHAIYSGRARLWQESSVIQAKVIELDRPAQTLTAIGNVRAAFQTGGAGGKPPGSSATDRTQLMRAEADRLIYNASESRAILQEGATLRSSEGTIQSASMDLFFAPAGSMPGAAAPAGAGMGIGRQNLTRAVALGNVAIKQQDRHAKAGRAEYTAADGKFVLSGESPTIYDSSGNATTGRQLTFIFADDTIVVDSEEGSRTLTLHRVQK
jgi:lipopolysaccharide export system protein LptA